MLGLGDFFFQSRKIRWLQKKCRPKNQKKTVTRVEKRKTQSKKGFSTRQTKKSQKSTDLVPTHWVVLSNFLFSLPISLFSSFLSLLLWTLCSLLFSWPQKIFFLDWEFLFFLYFFLFSILKFIFFSFSAFLLGCFIVFFLFLLSSLHSWNKNLCFFSLFSSYFWWFQSKNENKELK